LEGNGKIIGFLLSRALSKSKYLF